MKWVIIFLFFITGVSYSQTAPDWTLNDCNSANHTLYSYLDSEEVVVMFFVMGCSSCTMAGDYVDRMHERYDNSHPGKVNFFLMDYYPSNTCYDIDTTWNTYNFDAYFTGAWNVKDYYYPTLYPMPAIVIAAGSNHQVLYEDLSWQNSDTALIENSINAIINNIGLEPNNFSASVSVFPNPASENIIVSADISFLKNVSVKIYDLKGSVINDYKYSLESGNLSVHFLRPLKGEYIIELIGDGNTVRKKFILNP